MLTARTHCNAHAAYAKFRSALELLETFGLMGPGEKDAQATRAFEQELDRDYAAFIRRYQQRLNIAPIPPDDGDTGIAETPPLDVSESKNAQTWSDGNDSSADINSLSALRDELRRLRLENREQRTRFKEELDAQRDDFRSQLRDIQQQIAQL